MVPLSCDSALYHLLYDYRGIPRVGLTEYKIEHKCVPNIVHAVQSHAVDIGPPS